MLVDVERLEPGSIWAVVEGDAEMLAALERMLQNVTQELNWHGDVRELWTIEKGKMTLLMGLALALSHKAGTAGEEGGEDLRRMGLAEAQKRASKLVAAGILRDYQGGVVARGLSCIEGQGIIDVAMGGGKTLISCALAAAACGRWIYIVQNKELVAQAESTFNRSFERMRAVMELEAEEGVIVSMSYGDLAKETWEVDGIIVDECHTLGARNRALAFGGVRSKWKLGLSGTPLYRQDDGNALVVGLLGPIICTVPLHQLEENGHLCKGKVVFVPMQPRGRCISTAKP